MSVKPRFAGQPARRGPLVVVLILGLGLALAPVAFQMFDRAPKGGDMIDAFEPYMTPAKITQFEGYMAEMRVARTEVDKKVRPELQSALGLDAAAIDTRFVPLSSFDRQWPKLDADMSDMLVKMRRNIGNYEAVAALPPFPLFPWFFVIPGLLIAGLAAWGLRAARKGKASRAAVIAIVVFGLGVVAAPAIFQMFDRAPKGADMIDDFRSLMTDKKLRTIQGYFVTLGAGEGNVRTAALPALEVAAPAGQLPAPASQRFPAVTRWSEDWPTIFREFAPMIGVMSGNVANFAAVDALPPFWMFPWFFVIPGLIIAGAGVVAGFPRRADDTGTTTEHTTKET